MTKFIPPSRESMQREFWQEVYIRLAEYHERSPRQAEMGIVHYRWEAERREMGDVVYNLGSDRTADIVNRVIEHGLPSVER